MLLARDRRRGLVHAAAGLAVSMALLLVAANVGRNQYLSSLQAQPVPKPATAAIIDTVDAALLDSVRTDADPRRRGGRRGLRHRARAGAAMDRAHPVPQWLTSGPVHAAVAAHRKAFQWGVLVLGLVVLVLWNQPTVKVALIIVLVTLFVVSWSVSTAVATRRRPVAAARRRPWTGPGRPSGDTPPADARGATGAAPA